MGLEDFMRNIAVNGRCADSVSRGQQDIGTQAASQLDKDKERNCQLHVRLEV